MLVDVNTVRTYEETLLADLQDPDNLSDMTDPDPDPHIPPLVTAAQAADIIGVTRAMVSLLANGGALRGQRVGTTWVFRRVVAERYARDHPRPAK